MSTRSRISIINKDGTARSIYCHWDGYLTMTGAILQHYYKDEDKINKLMDLGDLSILGTEPVSTPESWANPVAFRSNKFCRSYKDRGDSHCETKEFDSVDDLMAFIDGGGKQECNYLFADGQWNYWSWSDSPDDMKVYNVSADSITNLEEDLSNDEVVACEHNPAALNDK